MTVSTASNRQDFTVSGTGPISFPHRIDAPAELQLWTRGVTGVKSAQAVLNVDYFVVVAADFQSATVTLSAAYATANSGKTCSLMRELPQLQPLNVDQVQSFSDGALESAFDRAAMRDQQLAEGLNEVVVKVGVTVTSQELIDAVAAADADRIAAETAAANAAASAGTAAAAGAGFFRAFLGGL